MTTAVRAGIALALTAGLGYAVCTLAFLLWPEIGANFMNALFHGLEFRKLQNGPQLFDFGRFAYVEVVLTLWAFWLGVLAGWLFERLPPSTSALPRS